MWPQTPGFHTRFRFCSRETELVLTDQLELHLLELPKYRGTLADLPRASRKERWAYFLRHAADLTVADIERLFREPAFVEAGRILEMISKTGEERLRYEMRVKAQRDQITNLQAAKEEGRAQGREEGREEGHWIGQIQLLQELLGDVVSPREELQHCELETLKSRAAALRARLGDKN